MELIGAEKLTFDAAKHEYRLSGEKIPSVTQILKILTGDVYANIPERNLQIAAERGSAIHEAFEIWALYGIDDVDSQYRPYMDAFLTWWKENKPEECSAETMLYHPVLRYAGTADLICKINGKTTLIDYKTTAKAFPKIYALQLEAYAQALRAHGIEVEDKIILHVMKNGKLEALHFPARDPDAWSVFGALLKVDAYRQQL